MGGCSRSEKGSSLELELADIVSCLLVICMAAKNVYSSVLSVFELICHYVLP